MRLLRAMFLFTAVASLAYAAGLLIPGLYPVPEVGPEGTAWARYLVPIYLGLAVVSVMAFRRPSQHEGVAWAFVLVWGGLALGHLMNIWLRDEEIGLITFGLLTFDSVMCGMFVIGIIQARLSGRVVSPYADHK